MGWAARARRRPPTLATIIGKDIKPSPETAGPDILYHYTDWVALRGILTSRTFRATAHQHTNDPDELTSADSEIVTTLAEMRASTHGIATQALDRLIAEFDDLHIGRKSTVYIISFSDTKDGEEHWRAYGRDGHGVCLGIRVDSEQQINPGLATGLINVSYDPAEWRHVIQQTVEPILSLASRADVALEPHNFELTLGTLSALASYSEVRAKNSTPWAFENESRFIAVPHAGSRPRVQISEIGKPYVSVVVRKRSGRIALPELIIGPNNDPDDGLKKAEAVLKEAGYVIAAQDYPKILLSSVPRWL